MKSWNCLVTASVPPRAADLVPRRASPPAGPGALLLERPPRRHERGLPRREAPLLRARHGRGPVLPGQHLSRLHRGEPTGERGRLCLCCAQTQGGFYQSTFLFRSSVVCHKINHCVFTCQLSCLPVGFVLITRHKL